MNILQIVIHCKILDKKNVFLVMHIAPGTTLSQTTFLNWIDIIDKKTKSQVLKIIQDTHEIWPTKKIKNKNTERKSKTLGKKEKERH